MKLFYKNTHICDFIDAVGDFPWVHGTIVKRQEYEKFKDFFAFQVLREREDSDGTKFDPELFDENNWTIEDGEEIIGIFEPYIYDETNLIKYRYRKIGDEW